ncbi:MAG: PEP-CTERM sorting domain-containing protein [Candidatus Hydrogenedentes bacterium]|nr:PEP-CTERM sorting domain-containing protein [Candidatus Hydrogenedentota bacterium]
MGTTLGKFARIFAGAFIAASAVADVIYDNGGPDAGTYGSNSTVELGLNPDFTAFDDFVLDDGNNVITDLHWWGNYYLYYSPQITDHFEVYIYADASGSPDLDLGPLYTIDGETAVREETSLDANGNEDSPVFAYDLFFDPITLDANVTYWLAITNGFYWYWQGADTTGTSFEIVGANFPGDIANWKDELDERDYNLAFNITGGVVPEPSTVVLLGAGVAALFVRQRMRRS